MTDEQIIKALECIAREEIKCAECAYGEYLYPTCHEVAGRDALDLINRQKAEIERLKGELGKEFICFVGDPHKVERCPYLEEMEQIKAEAIKEFAERVKILNNQYLFIWNEQLDNLVKEMIGEQ